MRNSCRIFSDIFSQRNNFITRIDARIKLVGSGIILLVILFSPVPFLPLVIFGLNISLLVLIRIPLRMILLRLAAPLILAGVALAVFALFYPGGAARGELVGARILGAVSLLILFGFSTPFNRILEALRYFRFPGIWIEVAMFAYRYIFVFIDTAVTIQQAQKMRMGYSGLKNGLRSFGVLCGALFSKAYDQSLRTYEAMRLRGYEL